MALSRRRTRFGLVVSMAFLFVSCASAESTSSVTGQADVAENAAPLLVDDFSTLSGETFDLAALQGNDVVLWFWSPW